jgi:hypothetical protein
MAADWSLGRAWLCRLSVVSLPSPSGLLVEPRGAEESVGVVISIGSPAGDGAEVWMVGVDVEVMMGTVREAIISSGWFPLGNLVALSIAVAIWSVARQDESANGRVPFSNN